MGRREDERIAGEFLESLQLGGVEHEPDGNVTPDFLLDGRIAVEVRRLNQNYELPNGGKEGFEGIMVGAWRRMQTIVKELGPSRDGESWNVFMQLRRPLDWKSLEAEVVKRLTAFMQAETREEVTLQFGENFELDLMRASKDRGGFFYLMGHSNADAGGAVMALVERNLRLCVEEKARKVAPFRRKYGEWWLVLINRVDLHMEREDYEGFGKNLNPPLEHNFDRIIIVDPWDCASWFDV